MGITAEQLRQVLSDLPPLGAVLTDVCRVPVREPFATYAPRDGRPVRKDLRYVVFRKSGGCWVLVSAPGC